MRNLKLVPLNETDFNEIVSAFTSIGWNKPQSIYEAYLKDQEDGVRAVFVAKINNQFAGYVTLKWHSEYSSFQKQHIPEISDLNVLPSFRNQGVGTKLIVACENLTREKGYKKIGLGVGLTADYGNAQKLYVKLAYIPDGRGIHYQDKALGYGETALVDDDLVLYLTKDLID